MIYWRLLRTICHLCVGLLTCAVIFPWIGAAGRTLHVQRWSLRLLKICRVRVEVINPHGAGSAVRALIVANHVSWLDIFVINAFEPCRFVAKADIRDWPLIGWLCAKTGTIFIARGRLRDVRRIYQQLVASLAAGERIAVFPEGTTAAQGELLPFHANLLEAALEAGVPVQPYALRYLERGGRLHPGVEFVGDTSFAQSLLTILKSRGITAQLTLLSPIEAVPDAHRRELAEAARNAIAAALNRMEV